MAAKSFLGPEGSVRAALAPKGQREHVTESMLVLPALSEHVAWGPHTCPDAVGDERAGPPRGGASGGRASRAGPLRGGASEGRASGVGPPG